MRRLTIRLALIAAAVAAIACANRGGQGPPGGPVAPIAPRVDRITPDSGSVNQRPGSITFHFTKVLNPSPGRGEFDQYFLISPTDGVPRVSWHRDHIDVRPRHGFKANTAYTVTLLPGLADVRGNAMKEGATTVFSTGATIPRFGLLGTVFDWAAERPAPQAIVEAISRPDSTVYLTAADSLGNYVIGPLNAGRYTLIGFVDRNNNRSIDPGEPWDSVTVLISTIRPSIPLLAITRDTFPPRITGLDRADSTTFRVTFDRALDPSTPLSPALFRVQRADSTEVPVGRVVGARAASDSLARRDTTTRRDTTASPRAPTPAVPLPGGRRPNAPRANAAAANTPPPAKPPRPAPETSVLVVLSPPATLTPGTTYRVTARDVRNIMGRPGTSNRTYTVPRPAPPSARDSAARRDTTRLRDSTRVPPRRPPA